MLKTSHERPNQGNNAAAAAAAEARLNRGHIVFILFSCEPGKETMNRFGTLIFNRMIELEGFEFTGKRGSFETLG